MERPIDIHLEKLKTKLIKMCSLVDEQVITAVDSIQNPGLNASEELERQDLRVDKYDLKINKFIYKTIALNQPVAIDLRMLLSALKINANLERIGDLAVSISRNSQKINSGKLVFSSIQFEIIADEIKTLLKLAFDSFIHSDSELIKKLFSLYEELIKQAQINSAQLIELMKASPEIIEDAVVMHTILGQIERIASHSVNIAKEVYFVISSKSLKHISSDSGFLSDEDDF